MVEKKKDETALAGPKVIYDDSLDIPLNFETIRQHFLPNGTAQEVALFGHICKETKLNPWLQEIYPIKYGNNPMSIVVAHIVYSKRAERTKQLNGLEFSTKGSIDKDGNGDLVGWCKIYRKDWEHPFYHEVDYSEYVQRTNAGAITKFWREKPKTMLKKVARSQALRICFPEEIGSLPYTREELGTEEDVIDIVPIEQAETEKVEEKKEKATKKKAAKKEKVEPEPEPEPEEKEPEKGPLAKFSSGEQMQMRKVKVEEEEDTEDEPEEDSGDDEEEEDGLDISEEDDEEEEDEETDHEALLNAVNQKLELLCSPKEKGGFGAKPAKLTSQLVPLVMAKYPGNKIKEFPKDLSLEQLEYVNEVLQITIKKYSEEKE